MLFSGTFKLRRQARSFASWRGSRISYKYKEEIKYFINIIFTIILSLTLIIVVLVILYFRRGIFTWLHRIYNRNQTTLADVELNEKNTVHLKPPIYSDTDDNNVPESTKKLARQIIQQLPPLRTTQLEDELPSNPGGPVKPWVELLMFKFYSHLAHFKP